MGSGAMVGQEVEAQEFILKPMEDYFFGEGAALPPGYVPPQAKN